MRVRVLTTRHCCQTCAAGARRSMAGAFIGYVAAEPPVLDVDSGVGGWELTTYWLPAAVSDASGLPEIELDAGELERVRRGGWPLAEVA